MVPSGWNLSCLGKLGNWSGGGTPSKAVSEYWENGNIPWVSPKDMGVKIISNTEDYITQKAVENSATKVYPANSILVVTRSGILRKRVPVALSAVPVSVNQDIKVLAPSDKFCPQYVANFMWCFNDSILAKCAKDGTTVESIDTNSLTEFPIKLPPLPEQRKIAQILSTWDKAITTTEQLLANSQQQKKALMQQLLTGKKRLLDENGERFRGEWKGKRLKSLCTIKTGKKDVNEGNPEGNYPFFTCASEPTRSDNYSYDCEALLIAGNGMLGKTHYFKGKFEAYQRTYILSEFIGLVVPYLHQYILYWLIRDIDREKQHGAMPYIKLGLLQNFKVFLPCIEEQQKIAAVLKAADEEISALQQKIEALKQEKKALMQQLLTGKRRVKVDEVAA